MTVALTPPVRRRRVKGVCDGCTPPCGKPTRPHLNGNRCEDTTPAALAGRPEPMSTPNTPQETS